MFLLYKTFHMAISAPQIGYCLHTMCVRIYWYIFCTLSMISKPHVSIILQPCSFLMRSCAIFLALVPTTFVYMVAMSDVYSYLNIHFLHTMYACKFCIHVHVIIQSITFQHFKLFLATNKWWGFSTIQFKMVYTTKKKSLFNYLCQRILNTVFENILIVYYKMVDNKTKWYNYVAKRIIAYYFIWNCVFISVDKSIISNQC